MTRKEFELAALSHLEKISAFARRICRTACDADDLVQDTYERAFDRWSSLRDPGRCRAWHPPEGRSGAARAGVLSSRAAAHD